MVSEANLEKLVRGTSPFHKLPALCGDPYRFEYAFHVLGQVIVPESQDAEAAQIQFGITLPVAIALVVLNAVEFDDQPAFEADEIRDRVSDRHLSSELQAAEPPAAEFRPEAGFGHGRRAPHPAGESTEPRIDALAHCPLTRFA